MLSSAITSSAVTGFAIGTIATAAGGAAFGGISTGTFQGALWGAAAGATVYLTGAVGAGVMSELRGGTFVQGFLASGFTALAGSQVSGWGGSGFGDVLARTVARTVVGGTASVIGGGRFENGAVTSGFMGLFVAAAAGYRAYTGYQAVHPEAGDVVVQKTYTERPMEYDVSGRLVDNVGEQGERLGHGGPLAEGAPLMRAFGTIPLVNATSAVHDNMQVSLPGVWRTLLNYPGMPPAAAFAFSAFIGQSVERARGVLSLPVDPTRRHDRVWAPVY